MSKPEATHQLRAVMGFPDLVLFYVVTVFAPRWIATAAAAGPSAITVWLITCVCLFVPLVFCVLELSSRYPQEGGPYLWSKQAFGSFAGFITGWSYWTSNLPYFPGLLYFIAANALFINDDWQDLSDNRPYFIIVSLVGLTLAVTLNIIGLNISKWLHNIGAICLWVPAIILLIMGAVAWWRFGSATEFTTTSLLPSINLKDIIFWSTIAFAFGGVESASTMGEEIENPRRNIPRAVITAAIIITGIYILTTICVLLALPSQKVSALQGIMQAIREVGQRTNLAGLSPLTAILITVSGVGAVGAWFAATARLPFVAGLDHLLPPAFGQLHKRWGTPHIALIIQALIAALFIFLSQAGTSVKGAYEVLVSMGIITYFIPFLFMFAALIKLQREPAGTDVIRVPGGKVVAYIFASLGFITTSISVVLAVIPSQDEPNKLLAITKTIGLTALLLLAGVAVYLNGKRKEKRAAQVGKVRSE
ncbi:MAG: APC family permease [Acidobacteriota bacterium]